MFQKTLKDSHFMQWLKVRIQKEDKRMKADIKMNIQQVLRLVYNIGKGKDLLLTASKLTPGPGLFKLTTRVIQGITAPDHKGEFKFY